jgi:transposase-like protein
MNTPAIRRYKPHHFPVEIISHGVWLYYQSCLSYWDVEELLFAPGTMVSYEAIRKRFLATYGPITQYFRPCHHRFSASAYRQKMQQRFHSWQELTILPTAA